MFRKKRQTNAWFTDDPLKSRGINQWRTKKISEGGAKFRHNRVTSQINFRGSAEGTTIVGVRRHALVKILQNYT